MLISYFQAAEKSPPAEVLDVALFSAPGTRYNSLRDSLRLMLLLCVIPESALFTASFLLKRLHFQSEQHKRL